VNPASPPPLPPIELDHLVVACHTLAAGRAWCQATFGVAAEAGGRHPLMATHNAVIAISSARFPKCYLELIAVDPEAPAPARRRWFDLDAPALQAALVEPRLVHWVARTSDIVAAAAALRGAGFDPGPIVTAERMTPRGLLRWRISVPDDGSRPAVGAVPLLIEWAGAHPVDALPASGIGLESLELGGVTRELAMRLGATASASAAAPSLRAVLSSPRGRVTLTVPTLGAA
jgi:Glyoxalase-like domain